MSEGPGGLADCSYEDWYKFKGDKWQDHVGYINDCKNEECSSTHEFVGRMNHWTSKIDTDRAKTETGGRDCPQTKGKWCGWAGNNYGVCQKTLDNFTDDWAKCCNENEKYSAKNNCIPYWYKDGDTYSNDCRKLCMGDESYGQQMNASETLKNDYEYGLCSDILKTNNIETDLRKFCQSEVAYKDGEPVEDYTKICGCYYPDEYYDNLKKTLIELFPEIPEYNYADKSCYSTLCSESDLNLSTRQCPDQYFLRCVTSSDFEVGGDMGDNSGIELTQTNECNIYVEKGEYPFCGRSCESDGDCPLQCPCDGSKCKNEDSVSCSNYTCPTDKIVISNALCVGDKNTCTEEDCCKNNPSSPPSSPPSGTPLIDDNILGISLIILGSILILIGVILFIYNIYYNVKNKNALLLMQGGSPKNIIGIILGIIFMIGGSVSLYFGIYLYNDNDDDDYDEEE